MTTRAELKACIRAEAGAPHHQCGTCALGPGPDEPPDLRLRVRGVTGLRVADASVIPRLPNAALHAPVVMVAERAAALVREDAA